MNTLEQILQRKRKEVAEKKGLYPIKLLEKSIHFESPTVSMKEYIMDSEKSGIIAEFKRKSPSKPSINLHANVEKVASGYMRAGASALSILTDEIGFGGCNADLTKARLFNYSPILRKDFIVDEYQIVEARSIGADCILLIAEALTSDQIKTFTQLAHQLQLQVLLEIHSKSQLDKIHSEIDLIGVNNRNLTTFKVGLSTALDLVNQLPTEAVKIAESGIQSPLDLIQLKTSGYHGFLIGQAFMRQPDPAKACRLFIQKVNELTLHSNQTQSNSSIQTLTA